MRADPRAWLGALRRRGEGLVFAAGAIVPSLLRRSARMGLGRGSAARATTLRRWRVLFSRGFEAFRKKWWIQLGLEHSANVYRYVFLIEKAALLNEPTAPRPDGAPLRVVALQPGHVGDLLLTVPMLRALRAARPDARVTLLTGPWNRDIGGRIPYVDEVKYYAPCWDCFIRGDRKLSFTRSGEWTFFDDLRRESVDVLMDCTAGGMPSLFALLALRPKTWIGADVVPEDLYPKPPEYLVQPYDSGMYEARRILNLLEPVGIRSDDDRMEFPLREDDRREAMRLLEEAGLRSESRYVVIAPGAGWPGKAWMSERFGELSRLLVSEDDVDVLVVGARSERELAANVASAAGARAHALGGRTPLGVLGALLERSRLFIGNDSGPYHLAVAVGAPALMLFGPGFPTKWSRVSDRTVTIRHDVNCQCFMWHPASSCHNQRACMTVITVREAHEAARDLLRRFGKSAAVER